MVTAAERRAKIRTFLSTLRAFAEKLIRALTWPNIAEKTGLLLEILRWLARMLLALQSRCLTYVFPEQSALLQKNIHPVRKFPVTMPPPDLIIPPDGLTEEERVRLLEGVHALIEQVPNVCGYKLKKSKPQALHALKDYAYLFSSKETQEAFVSRYGDIALPFSIEITNDGHLFRVLPSSVYWAEGKNVVVKYTVPLESHAQMLFQANTVFARKRVTLPAETMKQIPKLIRVKEESEKIPHLLPGYAAMVSQFQFCPENEDEMWAGPTEKCPNMQVGLRKTSLIMPLAPGVDLFEWWMKKSQSETIRKSLMLQPTVALNDTADAQGYRFRKYTALISASILMALENFRLHEANEEWVHRDLKPENIVLWMSDTDPVRIVTNLIDAEDIAPMSQGSSNRVAGTLNYIGKEVYLCWRNKRPLHLSSKTDSYAIGVVLLSLCFDNFYHFLDNPNKLPDDLSDLIRNCISYDRIIFQDNSEQVYYARPGGSKRVLLRPILPASSPDYQSLYRKVKAIAPMVNDDLSKRPFAIDVLKAAFMPEVEYLVRQNPALQDTPVVQALFEITPETAREFKRRRI